MYISIHIYVYIHIHMYDCRHTGDPLGSQRPAIRPNKVVAYSGSQQVAGMDTVE